MGKKETSRAVGAAGFRSISEKLGCVSATGAATAGQFGNTYESKQYRPGRADRLIGQDAELRQEEQDAEPGDQQRNYKVVSTLANFGVHCICVQYDL